MSNEWAGADDNYLLFIIQYSLLDDSVDVAFFHNHILGAVDVDLGAAIFAVEDVVAHLDGHLVVFGALAHGEDFASLGFLFCGVGNDDSGSGLLFGLGGLNQNAVC